MYLKKFLPGNLSKIIFSLLLIYNVNGFSQNKLYTIGGTVLNTDSAKFAYLTTLSQQVPISSDKVFEVVPIVDGKFQFKGSFDLEDKKYQYACVFVDIRGNISKEETLSKFRRLIWITEATKNIRKIILEDVQLEIPGYSGAKDAKVRSGGILIKQYDDSRVAVREGDRKLIEFIKKYPDSPIAFDQVVTITVLTDESNRDRFSSIYGTPEELFQQLSLKQKTSKAGIALKKKIETKKL